MKNYSPRQRSLCGLFALGLILAFVPGLRAQNAPAAPALPKAAAPAHPQALSGIDLIDLIQQQLTTVVRETRPAVVVIEGRLGAFSVSVGQDEKPLPQADAARLSPEKRKEFEAMLAQKAGKAAERARIVLAVNATGSGFLIPGGYVVTTADVVEKIKDHVVILADGSRRKAELMPVDRRFNVAILKVADIPANLGLKWGDSEKVAAGNLALTIGNQGGFNHTVTLCFIAGTNRAGKMGETQFENLLQFQGVVGGGSGGPLLNTRGEVIGMIVGTPPGDLDRIRTLFSLPGPPGEAPERVPLPGFLADGMATMAFALPANELKEVVERLQRGEKVAAEPGWLGVQLPTRGMDEEEKPAQVVGVYVDGPADKAGLQPGDVLVSINGQPVRSLEHLRSLAPQFNAGQVMKLEVRRNDKILHVPLRTEARPNEKAIKTKGRRSLPMQSGWLADEMCPGVYAA